MARPYPEEFPPELRAAAIAAWRFGYGARPGELTRISADPRGWLLAQLEPDAVPAFPFPDFPDSAADAAALIAAKAEGPAALARLRRLRAERLETEARAHTALALSTEAPFRERLVRFFANHFSLSMQDPSVFPLAFAFEREVIRPQLSGTFIQMLTAAVRHPALLLLHDNIRSIGPYSDAGLRGAPDVKEGLARAILSRYAGGGEAAANAKDVRALAMMLTGWSVAGPEEPGAGRFVFRENWHQPQSKYFQNRNYPEAGALEAEAALDALARRERTARALAEAMARHFVTDDPPQRLISDMLDGFTERGNDLLGVARGMVLSEVAWQPVPLKVKPPEELALSAYRTLGYGAEATLPTLAAMRILGQDPKHAPPGTGWPHASAAWAAPQQILERLDWGMGLARDAIGRLGRAPVADAALDRMGPWLRPATHRRLLVTGNRVEALGLLFAAPEFQRR
jgi:uncharacterized protein (DUF1800 family)